MGARRRITWWLTGTLAALAVALVAGESSGWPFLCRPLQTALTRITPGPATLDGHCRARLLWRPGVRAEHLRIGAGSGLALPYLLDARQVELGWRWKDLWRWRFGGELRVHRLHAEHLHAYLVRDDDGRASWQARPRSGPIERPAADLPRVGSLRVGNGQVIIADAPLQTQLRIELSGAEGEPQSTGYHMAIDGRYRALPLTLALRSGGALPLLQDAQDEEAPVDVPLRIEGKAGPGFVSFDGSAGGLLGARRLQGAVLLRGPSLAQVGRPLGLTLPQTPPFELKGWLEHAGGVWHLLAERAVIGRSRLDGDFRFDTRTQPPLLTGRLGGARLGFADLGPAVGVPPPGEAPAHARVLPQRRFDLPSLQAMDADVQLAIAELDFGSDALNPLRDLRSRLLLRRGVLRLEELQAQVAGGRFHGTTRLDPNVEPARWSADLRFANVDIAGWIAGLRPARAGGAPSRPNAARLRQERRQAHAGGAQPVHAYLTGALGGAVKASGHGRSVAEILGSLDGRAQLMLREGALSHLATEAMGLDVAQALGVMVRGDRPLPLRCAWLDLALQNGVVLPQQAVVDNADSELRIGGQVNLRDESLALRLVARPKDISPFSLRAPVTVHGTLAEPRVGVEGGALAGKAVGAVALGAAVGPLAALLPFVDLGVGSDQDACVRRPPAAQASGAAPARTDATR